MSIRFNAKGEIIVPFHRVGHDRPDLASLLEAVKQLPPKEKK
jgi:hypothetical protein|tara:strand:- start:438 stop:563 length:126 start_codon:yes stop_codon:yes gene_type:complete